MAYEQEALEYDLSGGDVKDKLIRELIDHSYGLILLSLNKKIQDEINQGLSK